MQAQTMVESGPGRRRGPVPWARVVFALGLVAGLVMVFVVSRTSIVSSGFDPYGFGEMGKSIARGHGFADTPILIQRKAPLYPAVIGAVYAIFGVHPQLMLVLQCLLFAGTCLLVFHIGRHLFNERTGVIAGVICAVHPLLLNYIAYLHLETLLTFLFTLLVWLMIRFYERPTIGNGALVGLAAGAGTLTKTVVLPYLPLFALGIILASRAGHRRGAARRPPWAALATMLIVLGCTLVPWTIRNYRSTGHIIAVSTGTSDAFLRGFIFSRTEFITLQKPPYTYAENESNDYFRALARSAGTEWQRNDWQTDQILNREAKRRLLAQPGQVIRKSIVGLFTFWYQLTSLKNSLLALVLAIGAGAFALVGWRRARREGVPSWLLLMPIIYLNVSLALLLALGRYSAPILPVLLVMSAFGIDSLLNRRKAARA